MSPANERFHADHSTRCHLDLRLELDRQLVLLDRVGEVVGQAVRADVAHLERTLEQRPTRAGPLGSIHGEIGSPHQVVDGDPVDGGGGDAHAAPRLDGFLAHTVGTAQYVHDLVESLAEHGEGTRRGQREGDDELVSAESSHQVVGPHDPAQAPGHLDEQLVTGMVSMVVVDGLEPVHVDHQDGPTGRAGFLTFERALQIGEESGPVGDTGQRVLPRLLGETPPPLDLHLADGNVTAKEKHATRHGEGGHDHACDRRYQAQR